MSYEIDITETATGEWAYFERVKDVTTLEGRVAELHKQYPTPAFQLTVTPCGATNPA